jgi:hypothetical protein
VLSNTAQIYESLKEDILTFTATDLRISLDPAYSVNRLADLNMILSIYGHILEYLHKNNDIDSEIQRIYFDKFCLLFHSKIIQPTFSIVFSQTFAFMSREDPRAILIRYVDVSIRTLEHLMAYKLLQLSKENSDMFAHLLNFNKIKDKHLKI